MSRFFLLIVALALVVAACSDDTADTTTTTVAQSSSTTAATTTTTSTSTTTLPPTTTTTFDPLTTVTTIPEGFASPINGLAAERDGLLDRRAIGVKIDNHPRARPQSGVNDADMVIEIRVEGGLTRFIAVFHDNESDYLGPNRSVRPTDAAVLAPMGAPMAMSGGQPWVQRVFTSRGVGLISTDGSAYGFRISAKVAPHNLYTNTELARQGADDKEFPNDPPGSLYSIVQWSIPETTADQIVLDWSDNVTAQWDWDGEQYIRTHNGSLHELVDEDGAAAGPIAVDVLVILAGEFFTQFPPPEDSDWQAVPVTETLGTGQAWVFSRGAVWEGTWERSDYGDPFTLLNPDGTEAGVPAGFSWVSIFPEQRTVTWE